MKEKRGFTLVELMIVLVIIGLVSLGLFFATKELSENRNADEIAEDENVIEM